MRTRYLVAVILCFILTNCTIYESVVIEQIDPPQIEFDNTKTHDWDKSEEQQWNVK